jgi:ribosomal-protein-alanine N-acetyltransferase
VASVRSRYAGAEIRLARATEAKEIHQILSEAFEPYRPSYTAEAYSVTVPSPREIEQRIRDPRTDVLVAALHDEVIGTVTVHEKAENELHAGSMAVNPNFQGQGIGQRLLEEVERLARERSRPTISLESFEPLTKAIALYERYGFERTGKERPYHGITIFEMRKDQTLRVSSDP